MGANVTVPPAGTSTVGTRCIFIRSPCMECSWISAFSAIGVSALNKRSAVSPVFLMMKYAATVGALGGSS